MALRQWMFDHVYLAPERQSQTENVRRVITGLYEHYLAQPNALSPNLPENDPLERRVVDYIAGMTDRFAIEVYKACLLPHAHSLHTTLGPDGELLP
jgi:dGTPase